ncbi:NAD(P)H-dependent oxidoreductase [Hamadaea tsunoensis]|uniref:NAD(P)H-dependent oxidoreductase n=1 Tax=Hamadaea tsunoensis TaxID=53368 RepID=UPI000424A936|nr:NAD(P)H-dependent oxidoreductase [Hamadaea tsunoensis]
MSNVHIVYAHPAGRSFTRDLLDSFVGGLTGAGHSHTLSDLYAMGFRPDLSAGEYARESAYDAGAPVAADVTLEHERLAAADVWAFVYPVWWNDCPALMKGWFDRVWTVGWAYRPVRVVARKALVLCTAGYTQEQLQESGCYEAMRTTMIGDRIGQRAEAAEFHLFSRDVPVAGAATIAAGL